jgi:hypothetical protein
MLTLKKMFVDGDLLCRVIGLRCQIFMVVEEGLMLGIELQAFILEVIPFLEDGIELQGQSVPHKLILNGRLELFKQPNKFTDLHLVALNKLLLMPSDSLLDPYAHALCCCLDAAQEALDSLALLCALKPDFHL